MIWLEAAQRGAEEKWAKVYWEGFENGRKAAQPRWYSIKKGEMPEDGEPVKVWGKRGYAIAYRERDGSKARWVECTQETNNLDFIEYWTPVLEKPEEEDENA